MPSEFQQRFDAHDWESTPLGPRLHWSPALQKAVEVMLRTAQPMFVIWGPERAKIFNEAYVPILGGRWLEALGRPLPALLGDIWDNLAPVALVALSGRSALVEEVPIPTGDSQFQETRFFTFSHTPLPDSSGDTAGSACIFVDTTSKVLLKARVAKERDRIFRMFEHTPGFIAMVEGPEHRFTYANPAYLRLVQLDSVKGLKVAEALPHIAIQELLPLLDQVYATGDPFIAREVPLSFEKSQIGGDRRRLVDFVYEAVRDDDGTVIGVFCEGHDVTEAALAREKVQALQSELIHVSRRNAMGAMASTIAHELNQPLAAISSYAFAGEKFSGIDPQSQDVRQCFEGIRAAAATAGNIIRSIRKFTQQTVSSAESVDLRTIIEEATSLAMVGAQPAGVILKYGFADDLTVAGDPIQLQQVLLNLIRNALDAMKEAERRELTITTALIGDRARVSVADTGAGLTPDIQNSLFEAFVTTKEEGMGMGLSISRTIIEAHSGSIGVFPNADGGATFFFDLPAL